MTVDPLDPETFADDEPEAPGPEVPEADAAEQRTPALPDTDRDDPLEGIDPSVADPADAADQARVVALDEDDDRG